MNVLHPAAFRAMIAAVALAAMTAAAQKSSDKPYEPQVGQAGKDVVWVPTPDDVVEKMLDLVQLQSGERHIDLGSGDGKIAIAAARLPRASSTTPRWWRCRSATRRRRA